VVEQVLVSDETSYRGNVVVQIRHFTPCLGQLQQTQLIASK
jgi:hypothetical protein